jgi:hypothetical protein
MIDDRLYGIAQRTPLLGILLLAGSLPTAAQTMPGLHGSVGPSASPVQHLSAYEGRWIADVPPQGRCPASRMTLDVRGSSIRGAVVNPFGIFPVIGSLSPAGVGTIRVVQMGGRIRFTDNRFVADYFNSCGPPHAVGARAGGSSSHRHDHAGRIRNSLDAEPSVRVTFCSSLLRWA